MSLNLSVQHLSGGETIIRPRGALGTCGWSPLPWQAAILEPGETPEEAFLRVNPRWEAADENTLLAQAYEIEDAAPAGLKF